MAFCAPGDNDAYPVGVTLPDETSALADPWAAESLTTEEIGVAG